MLLAQTEEEEEVGAHSTPLQTLAHSDHLPVYVLGFIEHSEDEGWERQKRKSDFKYTDLEFCLERYLSVPAYL